MILLKSWTFEWTGLIWSIWEILKNLVECIWRNLLETEERIIWDIFQFLLCFFEVHFQFFPSFFYKIFS